MKAVQEIRRAGILIGKRLSLFKYNVQLKMQRGQGYSPNSDLSMMSAQIRSMNLLDFSVNRQKDLFLLDIYSDQTIYGGLSETSLEASEDPNTQQHFCKSQF